MSLKDIRQAAVVRLTTILPTYNQMYDVFDIENNDPRTLSKAFAVRWGEGTPAVGPTRKWAVDSSLIVILTNTVDVRARDNVAPLIDDVYTDVETVIASFLDQTMLNIPEKMRGFKRVTIEAPSLIAGKKFVQVSLIFTVDHTIDLNT